MFSWRRSPVIFLEFCKDCQLNEIQSLSFLIKYTKFGSWFSLQFILVKYLNEGNSQAEIYADMSLRATSFSSKLDQKTLLNFH